MKRIMTVLLAALLLSVSLAACDPEARPPAKEKLIFDKAIIEPGEAYTDFEGMELRIVDGVWNAEEIELELRWTNNTGFDVLYGESYSVERERDGQWESCVMGDNLAFHLIGYDLKTGTAQKKTYNLTDIFDISENGKYRFITDCNVYHKGRGGESAKCNLWVEFTVTRVGDTSGDVRKRGSMWKANRMLRFPSTGPICATCLKTHMIFLSKSMKISIDFFLFRW